jgi:hypothetical protein
LCEREIHANEAAPNAATAAQMMIFSSRRIGPNLPAGAARDKCDLRLVSTMNRR